MDGRFLVKFSFNPTLVRLRPAKEGSLWEKRACVSIPRWFD